jgi:hypothetical protein
MTRLKVELAQVHGLESELGELSRHVEEERSELSDRKTSIEVIEGRYAAGAPPSVHSAYSRSINEYNALASSNNASMKRYQDLHAAYSGRVDAYNAQVKEANALGENIGGTWYVVPMPRAGGRAAVRTATPHR